MEKILDGLVSAGGKILLAIIVLIAGKIVIQYITKLIKSSKILDKMDGTVKSFMESLINGVLYIILVIIVIGVLGVPMASVITVLASAGVAIGLALQGALSNLAGGIMIMILKPFNVGDYVEAAGAEGVVQKVTLFYTVFLTVDNKRITVPNGSLMNSNVVDYSSEPLRRVDLTFSCAKSEKPSQVQEIILKTIAENEKSLKKPEPFARLVSATNEAMNFTARVWCKSEDYWDVYFDITQSVTEALAENGIQAPAIRIINEETAK